MRLSNTIMTIVCLHSCSSSDLNTNSHIKGVTNGVYEAPMKTDLQQHDSQTYCPQSFNTLTNYLRKWYLTYLNGIGVLVETFLGVFENTVKNAAEEIKNCPDYQEVLKMGQMRDNDLSEYVMNIERLRNETLNKENNDACIMYDFVYYLSIALKGCIASEQERCARGESGFTKKEIGKCMEGKANRIERVRRRLWPIREKEEVLRRAKQKLEIMKFWKARTTELKFIQKDIEKLECNNESLDGIFNLFIFPEDQDLKSLFDESRESLEAIHNRVDLIEGYLECTNAYLKASLKLCSDSRGQVALKSKELWRLNLECAGAKIKCTQFLNGKRCLFRGCHVHICNDALKVICDNVAPHISRQIFNKYNKICGDLERMPFKHMDVPTQINKECDKIREKFKQSEDSDASVHINNEYNKITRDPMIIPAQINSKRRKRLEVLRPDIASLL